MLQGPQENGVFSPDRLFGANFWPAEIFLAHFFKKLATSAVEFNSEIKLSMLMSTVNNHPFL
jgi:hypothetical protein